MRALADLWVNRAPPSSIAAVQAALAAWPLLFHQMEKRF